MDDQQVEAGLTESQSKVAALQATLVRLRTEVLDRPLNFPKASRTAPIWPLTRLSCTSGAKRRWMRTWHHLPKPATGQ